MSQYNDFGQPQQWPPAVSPQYSPALYGQPTTPFAGQAQQPGWAAPGAVPAQGRPATTAPGYPPGGLPGAQSYKEPAVAWVLWVFLGFAGAHHFYLGNTGRGVAYLVGWLLSIVTLAIVIGVFGFIALFVLWIIDATQMSARIQAINAQLFAANRARGLA